MRNTPVLLKQHIGWHFKKNWIVQGVRIPINKGAEKILTDKGIPVYNAEDIANPKPKNDNLELVEEMLSNKTDKNWHDRICYSYKDNNVLLEGLDQAKIITKTVEIKSGLPETFKLNKVADEVHYKVKNIVLNSHLFDAEQKKLPKLKDPERPAWNFPRVYGITEQRINYQLVLKLLQLVELHTKPEIVKQRTVLNNVRFSFPFEKFGDLIQLESKGDTAVFSVKPLSQISQKSMTDGLELPDLFPIKHTVTLSKDNIYQLRNIYPIDLKVSKPHPHTMFFHYNKTEVRNLYEEEVTEKQILGNSLMKTFTAAAAYAKEKFGKDVKELPTPVTLQSVHTDGKLFHFGVLQLNTLNLEDGNVKNIWYHLPRIPLFSTCAYMQGMPVLKDYNPDVINHIKTMYNNV